MGAPSSKPPARPTVHALMVSRGCAIAVACMDRCEDTWVRPFFVCASDGAAGMANSSTAKTASTSGRDPSTPFIGESLRCVTHSRVMLLALSFAGATDAAHPTSPWLP